MPEITIEQLWQMVNAGAEKLKEKDSRLKAAESRLAKLQRLVPEQVKIPRPEEIPMIIKEIREAIWGGAR